MQLNEQCDLGFRANQTPKSLRSPEHTIKGALNTLSKDNQRSRHTHTYLRLLPFVSLSQGCPGFWFLWIHVHCQQWWLCIFFQRSYWNEVSQSPIRINPLFAYKIDSSLCLLLGCFDPVCYAKCACMTLHTSRSCWNRMTACRLICINIMTLFLVCQVVAHKHGAPSTWQHQIKLHHSHAGWNPCCDCEVWQR